MKTSNISPWSEQYVAELQICLRHLVDPSYDPNAEGEERGRLERGDHVLDLIQQFFEVNLLFGGNPLKQLRAVFPDYEWAFFYVPQEDSGDAILRKLTKTDFFWPGFSSEDYCHWFTARRKTLEPDLMICGCRDRDFFDFWDGGGECDLFMRLAWKRGQ